MSYIRFNDGMSFDTGGPLRLQKRRDGWYVVGEGMLIPVADSKEGKKVIREMSSKNSHSDR